MLAMRLTQVAAQLYTLRDHLKTPVKIAKTLRRVRAMGYPAVQISGLGPIPSDSYPYVQKFWPQISQMSAVWTSSNQEGQSLLFKSIKPVIIGSSYLGIIGIFLGFGFAGISSQFIYGGLGAMSGFPHYAIIIFIGACLGRFVLAKRFGAEKWQNYAPILAVGFGAGMGLVGMLSIAINFLWVSIGNGQ